MKLMKSSLNQYYNLNIKNFHHFDIFLEFHPTFPFKTISENII